MRFKRKMYDRMLHWKAAAQGKSALFVDGARRVGKSWLCEQFAANEYDSYILVDFGNMPDEVRAIFSQDTSDLNLFFLRLSAFYRVRLHARRSAIVFDEVQLFPRARQLVKYLVVDGRYDIIETGSLITLLMKSEEILIPSEEEHVELFPLDFEEFLWACGDEATVPVLRAFYENRQPLGQALLRRVMSDFRIYMLVGGMPQALAAYLEANDFAPADRCKRQILSLYREDAAKFARNHAARVRAILDQVPAQLATREKVFRLSSLGKQARMREYEDAFTWLEDAMIVNTCRNASEPNAMLAASEAHTTQKLYMADTGLLTTLAFADRNYAQNTLYRAVLFDKLHVNEGMLAENVVAQMLRTRYPRLFFYARSDTSQRANMMEIDFLLPGEEGKPFPVEVKTGRYKPHASLDKFRRKFKGRIGQPVILYAKDILEEDGIVHLPMFMAMFL